MFALACLKNPSCSLPEFHLPELFGSNSVVLRCHTHICLIPVGQRYFVTDSTHCTLQHMLFIPQLAGRASATVSTCISQADNCDFVLEIYWSISNSLFYKRLSKTTLMNIDCFKRNMHRITASTKWSPELCYCSIKVQIKKTKWCILMLFFFLHNLKYCKKNSYCWNLFPDLGEAPKEWVLAINAGVKFSVPWPTHKLLSQKWKGKYGAGKHFKHY